MKGKSEARAIVAARAVLPDPGEPDVSEVEIYDIPCSRAHTSGVRAEFRTCSTSRLPSLSISCHQHVQTLAHVDSLRIVDDSVLYNLLEFLFRYSECCLYFIQGVHEIDPRYLDILYVVERRHASDLISNVASRAYLDMSVESETGCALNKSSDLCTGEILGDPS